MTKFRIVSPELVELDKDGCINTVRFEDFIQWIYDERDRVRLQDQYGHG